jgi:hypothetical protein
MLPGVSRFSAAPAAYLNNITGLATHVIASLRSIESNGASR